MYRLRFHLASGKNYKKWQLRDLEKKTVRYYEPEDVTIVMTKAVLHNSSRIAKKIHAGSAKQVCAWIQCDNVEISDSKKIKLSSSCSYNPRKKPYWVDSNGHNIDGKSYDLLMTRGRKIFEI